MSGNLDNDTSLTSSKMYPIDLAPQKITIVKSVSNTEVKMAHLIPGQPKTTVSNQILTHASTGSGMMRPGITQIISPNVASQSQMIVSSSPILPGTQIVSQGSQLLSQGSQLISQSQLITPSGQILSPATQIISQGTQLSAPISSSNNTGSNNVQSTVASSVSGTQVLNVGGQLVSSAANLVVNSSVRTLPPTVRVLPPHHNTRPAVQLSSVNVNTSGSVLVSKNVGVGVTSHVPRGLAAGASLAVRPVAPAALSQQPGTNQGGAWAGAARGRGALVYGARAAGRQLAPVSQSTAQLAPHSTIVTLPTTSILNRVASSVISGPVRGSTAAPVGSAPRPLPLLQRNYQPAKVVGVSNVGVRGVVGNSAPAQLYYEVPRAHAAPHAAPHAGPHAGPHAALPHQAVRPLAPYALSQPQPQSQPAQVSVVNAIPALSDNRSLPTSVQTTQVLPRPTILRKRDQDGSPHAGGFAEGGAGAGAGAWEGGGSGGSTTVSASSSPAPDDEPDTHAPPIHPDQDVSPRKKPRKQLLMNEVRQCEFQSEDPPPTSPSVTVKPPPKRPLLSSSYVCGWRGTALHFARPADVRRREPRARDLGAIARQPHALSSADGWKVHHLTAQMDDLMLLESDVGDQLAGVLRALEAASGRALAALQPHSHTLLELLKGNIQRSKIVCEGIQEAREDILRVFTHRNFVSDILTRQADKRCFRKHRSQS